MSHIEEEFLKIEQEHGWNNLFVKLANDHRMKTSNKKADIALLNMNRGLNRFRDVLPYDDTRVRLLRGSNDYINANYVQIPSANRKYILTQGPLPTTSNHFWQMIWEQNSRVIVMLTRLIEKGCAKCWLYYPDYQNASELTYDDVDLKVVFVSDRQHRHYTERKFELINLLTGESRVIIHWSDFDWPDHGAPSNPEPFLQLLRDVRHCGAFDPRFGPPVLHCSAGKYEPTSFTYSYSYFAGIGRSGTFVFVDSILKTLAHTENPGDISLIDILSHIRSQRAGLIQTAEQLRFSYRAIIAGMKVLTDLERNEELFTECEMNLSGESDSDTDEQTLTDKKHPKGCGRQDNIMPNGRLSDSLEDINCELMRRADSNASSYHPSPKTMHRLISKSESRMSSEDLKQFQPVPLITPQDVETSLRLRQERLVRNENLEKKVNDLKAKLQRQNSYNETTLFTLLTTKYRRPFLIGILTIFTGTFFLYKFAFGSNRNR
ncbi:unnamed protein product [Adineta ricciae]|uniref:protein-tyrosine-phosphatase n=1 Tax=Adineta ricciae TaxID=249248 RepID=A0A815QKN5_ADIRI|nr:unnamed protein product [Adineta ricciae]